MKLISLLFTSATLLIHAETAIAQFNPNLINSTSTENLKSIFSPNIPSSEYALPFGDINQQGGIINNNVIAQLR